MRERAAQEEPSRPSNLNYELTPSQEAELEGVRTDILHYFH